jgi:hypothetical protein
MLEVVVPYVFLPIILHFILQKKGGFFMPETIITTSASQSREDNTQELPNDKKYIVRHNKQSVELSIAELLSVAEKGLDYDRIRPSHDYVKQLATKSGETDVFRYINKAADLKTDSTNSEQTPASASKVKTLDSQFEETQKLLAEYPEVLKGGILTFPDEVLTMTKNGMNTLEAFRIYDLARTKTQCDELNARLEAELANKSNAQVAMGSLQGGDAVEKDYYSSKEWDRLPQNAKEKYIKNGKIYEFMRKWSESI